MGKGDQRSRRGKVHRGTFGKRRPKAKLHKPARAAESDTAQAAPAKEKSKEAKVLKKPTKE